MYLDQMDMLGFTRTLLLALAIEEPDQRLIVDLIVGLKYKVSLKDTVSTL